MEGWTEKGYGFELVFTEDGLVDVVDFLLENDDKQAYKGKENAMREAEDELGLQAIIGIPVCQALAQTINRLEGQNIVTGYAGCEETDEKEHLGISPRFPWEYTGDCKPITKEKADEILCKYAPLIGIENEPSFFKVQYFSW